MSDSVKDFLGVATGILALVLTVAFLIFGTWGTVKMMDGGPKADARKSLFGNCSRQFKAGVFDEVCISLVLEK